MSACKHIPALIHPGSIWVQPRDSPAHNTHDQDLNYQPENQVLNYLPVQGRLPCQEEFKLMMGR